MPAAPAAVGEAGAPCQALALFDLGEGAGGSGSPAAGAGAEAARAAAAEAVRGKKWYASAAGAGVPVVAHSWLIDSAAAGAALPLALYTI